MLLELATILTDKAAASLISIATAFLTSLAIESTDAEEPGTAEQAAGQSSADLIVYKQICAF